MENRADPRLVWLAAVLMAAVTIVYIANRSMYPERFHTNLPTVVFHFPHA